jgi:hypothetical protein
VKRWATLTLQREFKVVKSSPHIYDVQCLKPNCPLRVYASKGKWKNYWEIKSIVDHTCVLEKLDVIHRNFSSGFVKFFIYLFCFDFRKINGRTKNFEKYASGAIPHGGRSLPPRPTVLSPYRHGARWQDSTSGGRPARRRARTLPPSATATGPYRCATRR